MQPERSLLRRSTAADVEKILKLEIGASDVTPSICLKKQTPDSGSAIGSLKTARRAHDLQAFSDN